MALQLKPIYYYENSIDISSSDSHSAEAARAANGDLLESNEKHSGRNRLRAAAIRVHESHSLDFGLQQIGQRPGDLADFCVLHHAEGLFQRTKQDSLEERKCICAESLRVQSLFARHRKRIY